MSLSLQTFNFYSNYINNLSSINRIKGMVEGSLGTLKNNRAKKILLPRVVAVYLTKNNDYMDDEKILNKLVAYIKEEDSNDFSKLIIRLLKANPDEIKIDKNVIYDKEKFEKMINEIFENFFYKVKLESKNTEISNSCLSGNYNYDKFCKFNTFKDYRNECIPENSDRFKEIKSIVRQSLM